MSTVYVPLQDRMRLTAEMENGEVQVLWLTQRMLRLALAPLGGYFEKTPEPTPEQKARRGAAELLHKVSGKAGPPVTGADATGDWLIESLDIRMAEPVHFVFKGDQGRSVHMDMDILKLRQWLGILHRKCAKAGWPESLWPAVVLEGLD